MRIPKSYTIFGNKVTVKEVYTLDDNNYGRFNDATETITLAHHIKDTGEIIALTPTQIESTFFHEVIHSFQFYSGRPYDEVEAQTYANMLIEFIKSSGIKINPNVVHEPSNPVDDE